MILTQRDIELSYLAGFLDGEGYLTMYKGRNPNGTVRYHPLLRASQKHRAPLERIQASFGGTIKYYTKKSGRSYYRWTLWDKACLELLRELLPHLTLKRAQALELLKVKLRNQNWDHDYTPQEERARIAERLKELKHGAEA